MLWFAYAVIAAVGVVQLPFLLDLVDALYPQWGVGRVSHRVLSKALVLLLLALLCAAYGVFVLYFVPYLAATGTGAAGLALHAAGATLCWLLTVGHYLAAAFRDPAGAPEAAAAPAPPLAAAQPGAAPAPAAVCRPCGGRGAGPAGGLPDPLPLFSPPPPPRPGWQPSRPARTTVRRARAACPRWTTTAPSP